jgi:hypothetical protein
MAIISPADLPSILRVRSEPMKKYVLSKLGYPHDNVELSEDQWETIYRVAGDFIAGYFPREQRLAVFYTQPLVSTYPLPADAYWVQQVNWDPITTRIDDVFGAESFLFCLSPEFNILDKDGRLQQLGNWEKHWKAKTPYGNKKMQIVKRDILKPLPKIKVTYETGSIDATVNHVLNANKMWKEFRELLIDDELITKDGVVKVTDTMYYESKDAISVRALDSGCYYGCTTGEPVLLH